MKPLQNKGIISYEKLISDKLLLLNNFILLVRVKQLSNYNLSLTNFS